MDGGPGRPPPRRLAHERVHSVRLIATEEQPPLKPYLQDVWAAYPDSRSTSSAVDGDPARTAPAMGDFPVEPSARIVVAHRHPRRARRDGSIVCSRCTPTTAKSTSATSPDCGSGWGTEERQPVGHPPEPPQLEPANSGSSCSGKTRQLQFPSATAGVFMLRRGAQADGSPEAAPSRALRPRRRPCG